MTEGRLNLNRSLTASLNDDPAIFSVTPQVTNVKETITIKGIGFGTIKGVITFTRPSFPAFTFPAADILSWTNEQIVARIAVNCPTGRGRLRVATSAGTSRGAYFRLGTEKNNEWILPTWVGETILMHEEAAYAQVGNDVWIISGNSNYGQTGMVERFSLLTFRGEVRPEWEIPKAVRRAGAAAIGTKIYVVGGYDDWTAKYQKTLQIFDITTGTWTRGTNLPQYLDGLLW